MQTKYKQTSTKPISLNHSKIKIKKLIIAHQQAPIDYISPWQAHHQHNLHALHSQSTQNPPIKNKLSDSKQNVVNSFLAKIRRTQNMHRKNKFNRNYSMEDETIISGMTGPSLGNTQVNLTTNLNMKSKNRVDAFGRSISYNISQTGSRLYSEAHDVGFGLIQYKKNTDKQSKTITQQLIDSPHFKKSYTFYNKQIPNHRQVYSQLHKNTNLQNYQQFQKLYDPHTKIVKNKHQQLDRQTKYQHRSRIFTQQQLLKPTEVVFIKKKKCKKNITIVDINSTAQQFYEQQVRCAQQNMLQKYKKLANNAIQNKRCATQQNHRSVYNRSPLKGLSKNKTQVQQLEKKYSFLGTTKDQSILFRAQNIMKNHPALANTLFIAK